MLYAYIKTPKPFPKFDADTREEWINEAANYLRKFRPLPWTREVGVQYSQDIDYMIEGYGFIKFPNRDWICILTRSCHEDEPAFDKSIGDVILAIDSHGNLYSNDAHPCKSIIIRPESKKEFQTIDEFLKTVVDPPGGRWVLFNFLESR